jgi:hypothetical protein
MSSTTTKSCLTEFKTPEDRLYYATRAFILFAQGLFSSRSAGHWKWHPNTNETEIIIAGKNPESAENANQRPIISIGRTEARWHGISRSGRISENFIGTKFTLADIIGFTILVTCVAKEGVEAGHIAWIVSTMFDVFRRPLMRKGRIHAFTNQHVIGAETRHGQLVPGSSFPDWIAVQLAFPCQVQHSLHVDTESNRFQSLFQAVTIRLEDES